MPGRNIDVSSTAVHARGGQGLLEVAQDLEDRTSRYRDACACRCRVGHAEDVNLTLGRPVNPTRCAWLAGRPGGGPRRPARALPTPRGPPGATRRRRPIRATSAAGRPRLWICCDNPAQGRAPERHPDRRALFGTAADGPPRRPVQRGAVTGSRGSRVRRHAARPGTGACSPGRARLARPGGCAARPAWVSPRRDAPPGSGCAPPRPRPGARDLAASRRWPLSRALNAVFSRAPGRVCRARAAVSAAGCASSPTR